MLIYFEINLDQQNLSISCLQGFLNKIFENINLFQWNITKDVWEIYLAL